MQIKKDWFKPQTFKNKWYIPLIMFVLIVLIFYQIFKSPVEKVDGIYLVSDTTITKTYFQVTYESIGVPPGSVPVLKLYSETYFLHSDISELLEKINPGKAPWSAAVYIANGDNIKKVNSAYLINDGNIFRFYPAGNKYAAEDTIAKKRLIIKDVVDLNGDLLDIYRSGGNGFYAIN